jgi:hypothetical protein
MLIEDAGFDQNETKRDSDTSEQVERAGRDELLGDPDEHKRRKDADTDGGRFLDLMRNFNRPSLD